MQVSLAFNTDSKHCSLGTNSVLPNLESQSSSWNERGGVAGRKRERCGAVRTTNIGPLDGNDGIGSLSTS